MADLVAFLEARITEDADDAVLVHDLYCDLVVQGQRDPNFGWECTCHVPARVLAECKAKRAIITQYCSVLEKLPHRADSTVYRTAESELFYVLISLAQSYADHPDFNPEWTTS